jgi:hypothetical protein
LFARLGEDYLLNTLGALLTAIRAGEITVDEAEALRVQLRENRFEMDSTPFDDLLKEEWLAMSDFFLSGLLSPPLVYRSISEWQQLARAGSLRPDDQLFDPGHGVWQRAADHPALWPHFPMPSVKLAGGVGIWRAGDSGIGRSARVSGR